MAKTKSTVPTLEPASWFYHPAPADLAGAGFKPDPSSPQYLWHWVSQETEPWARTSVMVSLIPKRGIHLVGETFIYSSRYGHTEPNTVIKTRQEFSTLLKRFGWKPQPKVLHLPPAQENLQQAA